MDDAAAPDGRRVPLLRWALICSVDTQIGRAEDAEARGCDKAPTATTRDRGPPTASTPFPGPVPSIRRGTLSRKRPTAQLFCPRASNRLILLVFSPSARARRRKAGAKNYRRNRKNRLEPFGDLRRLIGEQADKAGITAPIGAHAPPIPCADQRDPPGFPRPGGSVFGGCVCSFLATRKRFCLRPRHSRACASHTDYDVERFAMCHSGTTEACEQSVVAYACS